MNKKAIGILLASLLIGTIFTVVFAGSVSAANDDHNLSGVVWRADGSSPGTQTEFCIHVEYPALTGIWTRYPDTGWVMTDDDINGLWWYSYVLPNKDRGSTWDDGALYRVQINGAPWGEFNGNATSNGTGSAGDPFPVPYDPISEDNKNNTINHAAGGGYGNEQQWDVRTTAPVDLVPTNITAYGEKPQDFPFGIPVPPDTQININFNVTNFGLVDSGVFWVTLWNCTSTGQNIGVTPIAEFSWVSIPGGGDSGVIVVPWLSPLPPADFYVNITVDSQYDIAEYNEVNNTFILHFIIGPDLVVLDVYVKGTAPSDPVYVDSGELVRIDANVMNVGFSSTGNVTRIAITDITGPGGPMVPGSQVEFDINTLAPGETSPLKTWFWTAPVSSGDYYVNVTADFQNDTWEASEDNNNITIHFAIGPDLVPNNVTGDGMPVITEVLVTPLQLVTIGVNASNIGPSGTGSLTFVISYRNCTSTGTPTDPAFFISSPVGPVPTGGFSQDVYDQWLTPLFDGSTFDYYILITIDHNTEIAELNESNNEYILHLKMDAPDLTYDDLSVEVQGISVVQYNDPDGLIPPFVSDIPVEVPLGEDVTIWATVINLGGVDMTTSSNVTYYNVSGVGGPPIAIPFWEAVLPIVNSGQSTSVFGIWPNPMALGTYYVNVSIDYNGTIELMGRILELNEFNNTFTLNFSVTPIPVTNLQSYEPTLQYNSTVRYITSTTDLYFTVIGPNPPFYTWYRIINLTNGSEAMGWTNYTLASGGNFIMTYGEGTFRIEFNSTDAVGAEESTKYRIVIVDDSEPQTSIVPGDPKYRLGMDNWNITSSTPITLSAMDNPLDMSIIGIENASGIDDDDKLESGIFYRIQRVSDGFFVQDLTEATIITIAAGVYTADDFVLLSVWGDGYYRIWYNSTDNLGNIEAQNVFEVYLDNTPPVTDISIGDPKYPVISPSFVKSDTLFTLDASESVGSGADLSSIQYSITYNGSISSSWIAGTVLDIGTAFPQGDGTYDIQYVAQDNLGNLAPTSNITINVDDTPPSGNLVIDLPRYRVNTTHNWNITDETEFNIIRSDGSGCGVDYTVYRIINDTVNWSWTNYLGVPFDLSTLSLDDGLYTIEFISYDFLDNSQVLYETLYLDNTPPTTLISDPIGMSYRAEDFDIWNITDDVEFNLTADDGLGCGVNFTQYHIFNNTYDSGWTLYAGNFTLPVGINDGIYTIEYQSEDYLGNDLPDSTDVNMENSGPITTIDWPHTLDDFNTEQNAWEVDFPTQFTLTADDGMGSGVALIEYRIRIDDTTWTSWENYSSPFNLTVDVHGHWDHTIEFRATDNLGNIGPTGDLDIYIEGDITPPLPPILTLRVDGSDIILEWESSPDPDIDHYLIYNSTSKTGFNFSTPWKDTSVDSYGGIIPLRNSWTDTDAVNGHREIYYAIRGVDHRDNMGYTSNIAGKVTMTFEEGYNTFSLPLEPFEDITAVQMLGRPDFGDTDTLYMYKSESKQWISHPKFLPSTMDDFTLNMGEGYMLFIMEEEVKYTFVGSPATSLRFKEGVGDESGFRDSLTADVEDNDVVLNWNPATGATGYKVFRASERMGDESFTNYSLEPVSDADDLSADTTSYRDEDAVGSAGDEYYYMVVALDSTGEESSGTYAIGVKTYELKSGYTLFSLEFEPKTSRDVAWYGAELLVGEENALFYYDKNVGTWVGHPNFIPDWMNTMEIGLGEAYIAYIHAEDVTYSATGI